MLRDDRSAAEMSTPRVRVLGAGRAGGSFTRALGEVGWSVDLCSRDTDPAALTADTDLVLLCVPDAAVADIAANIAPDDSVVVAHCAGSLGLDVLDPAPRRASLHPLVALPDAGRGAAALRGAWFAVAGDPLVERLVDALAGRPVRIDDHERVRYHAAAVIASNHLVALMGQVERVAAQSGMPLEAFLELMRGTIDNVEVMGAADALTGPVARGDWDTVRRHLAAIDPQERAAYRALAGSAALLVDSTPPDLDDR